MKKTTMILLALASVTILASCDKHKNEEVDG
ncbi:MAG: protein involved in sex pheromone biosynthesis, partial [Arenicella sp.]